MTEPNDPVLERRAKRLLDEAAQSLDADTLARLRAVRARAWQLAGQGTRPPAARPRTRGWLPVGGLTVAGVVFAVAGTLWLAAPGAPMTGLEDIELLASTENPEFYADIEFYDWLADRADAS